MEGRPLAHNLRPSVLIGIILRLTRQIQASRSNNNYPMFCPLSSKGRQDTLESLRFIKKFRKLAE